MKKVAILINKDKPQADRIACEAQAWLTANGAQVVLSDSTAVTLRSQSIPVELWGVDAVLVLGGDGTLLNVARLLAPYGTPIMGINMGQLGFLTELELADMYDGLAKLLADDYTIDQRMMLEAKVLRNGQAVESFLALNDVVITKGAFSRMIQLETSIGDHYLATYPADGLIVSTATGSTAYSLSAGGPIVSPEVEIILLTPICPHTLYSRPMVVSHHQVIKVVLRSHMGDVMITVDGQRGFALQEGDEIFVTRAHCNARMIKLHGRSFFEVVRQKLREGGRSSG